MKKLLLAFFAFIAFAATSCIENEDIVFKGELVEMDAATWNANTTGKDYPVLTRVPAPGRNVYTATTNGFPADPLITRSTGKIKLRVNLVGAQQSVDQVISYGIVPNETFVSGTIAADAAVKGTHYNTGSTFTIPANSSFGFIEIDVINPGTALAKDQLIVIELIGNDKFKPSANEKRVGLVINKG